MQLSGGLGTDCLSDSFKQDRASANKEMIDEIKHLVSA